MAYYFVIKELHCLWLGTAVAQWLRCCATNRKVGGSIPGVIGIFHWHKLLPIALWSWGWLSLQQKWVPGIFPGGKDGRCVRLTTLPLSCAVVMKSGNLNFLEPSGPLQACNGAALPLYIYVCVCVCECVCVCGPGSSVGIATDYGLNGPGSNPGGYAIFRPSRPAVGPTQPPVKWLPGLSRG
jgi:hypothetical protein